MLLFLCIKLNFVLYLPCLERLTITCCPANRHKFMSYEKTLGIVLLRISFADSYVGDMVM